MNELTAHEVRAAIESAGGVSAAIDLDIFGASELDGVSRIGDQDLAQAWIEARAAHVAAVRAKAAFSRLMYKHIDEADFAARTR